MTTQERYSNVLAFFSEAMPTAGTELHYTEPFELLVATILAAQCTDKRVNMVTPALFARYPDAAAMATATPEEIFPYIRSVSYPNNKAKHLAGMARMVAEEFNGTIPGDVEQLQRLPGVGRKTANVVAAVIFRAHVMPVDTHVFRVAARIGLTRSAKTPLQTELQLTKHIPGALLPQAHHWLILHGRYVCMARKPKCDACGITVWCDYFRQKEKKNGKE